MKCLIAVVACALILPAGFAQTPQGSCPVSGSCPSSSSAKTAPTKAPEAPAKKAAKPASCPVSGTSGTCPTQVTAAPAAPGCGEACVGTGCDTSCASAPKTGVTLVANPDQDEKKKGAKAKSSCCSETTEAENSTKSGCCAETTEAKNAESSCGTGSCGTKTVAAKTCGTTGSCGTETVAAAKSCDEGACGTATTVVVKPTGTCTSSCGTEAVKAEGTVVAAAPGCGEACVGTGCDTSCASAPKTGVTLVANPDQDEKKKGAKAKSSCCSETTEAENSTKSGCCAETTEAKNSTKSGCCSETSATKNDRCGEATVVKSSPVQVLVRGAKAEDCGSCAAKDGKDRFTVVFAGPSTGAEARVLEGKVLPTPKGEAATLWVTARPETAQKAKAPCHCPTCQCGTQTASNDGTKGREGRIELYVDGELVYSGPTEQGGAQPHLSRIFERRGAVAPRAASLRMLGGGKGKKAPETPRGNILRELMKKRGAPAMEIHEIEVEEVEIEEEAEKATGRAKAHRTPAGAFFGQRKAAREQLQRIEKMKAEMEALEAQIEKLHKALERGGKKRAPLN